MIEVRAEMISRTGDPPLESTDRNHLFALDHTVTTVTSNLYTLSEKSPKWLTRNDEAQNAPGSIKLKLK